MVTFLNFTKEMGVVRRINNLALRKALGDSIIPNPKVVWNSVVYVPRQADDTWKLLSRLGLPEEGGAGYFLPERIERRLPQKLHSVVSLASKPLPSQRKIGERLRDIPQGSFAVVVRFDNEARIMVLESNWPATKANPEGLHYTWAVRVCSYGEGAVVLTRTRIENPQHPVLLRCISRADHWAMSMIARGLAERIPRIASTKQPSYSP